MYAILTLISNQRTFNHSTKGDSKWFPSNALCGVLMCLCACWPVCRFPALRPGASPVCGCSMKNVIRPCVCPTFCARVSTRRWRRHTKSQHAVLTKEKGWSHAKSGNSFAWIIGHRRYRDGLRLWQFIHSRIALAPTLNTKFIVGVFLYWLLLE